MLFSTQTETTLEAFMQREKFNPEKHLRERFKTSAVRLGSLAKNDAPDHVIAQELFMLVLRGLHLFPEELTNRIVQDSLAHFGFCNLCQDKLTGDELRAGMDLCTVCTKKIEDQVDAAETVLPFSRE